jgi:hypothetical protein
LIQNQSQSQRLRLDILRVMIETLTNLNLFLYGTLSSFLFENHMLNLSSFLVENHMLNLKCQNLTQFLRSMLNQYHLNRLLHVNLLHESNQNHMKFPFPTQNESQIRSLSLMFHGLRFDHLILFLFGNLNSFPSESQSHRLNQSFQIPNQN